MPAYFSLGTKNSDSVSERYLQINNCGFCEDMDKTAISRPQGRKDYQLIYVDRGQMEIEENGQTRLLTDGHVYLYRPGTPQHYRVNGVKTTFFWIHFTGTAVAQMLEGIPDGSTKTGFFHLFISFCKAFYLDSRTFRQPDALTYESFLISIFAALSEKAGKRGAPTRPSNIDNALLAMNRSIEQRLSNEELARLCGLNKFYFIKYFKGITGQTPQQYYTQLALDTAKGLLESTDYTVARIGVMCGVEDGFYFSRLFKKHVGCSPSDYRKNIRHGNGGQIAKNVL